MNLQSGQTSEGKIAHLCSTQHQLGWLQGWGWKLYKGSFTNMSSGLMLSDETVAESRIPTHGFCMWPSFLTSWWLGSKSKHLERARQKKAVPYFTT